ncbi:DUF222 domain-containing protein [Kribbella sp. NPDC026596]|uniref:DUF222 domain-containing protein n=1 Tax=Kribbella sp. NPDC026596 TaxID=3155122 RepID=UPI0034086AAD
MELLGERPVWSMSSSEKLTTLDTLDAELARLETYRLHLIAALDHDGYAEEIGAHDTAQLLAFRYRQDPPQARRDLRLARTLPKYTAVTNALPAVDDDTTADAQTQPTTFLRPAQAEAIVTTLERVPTSIPAEDIAVAERELVTLARHLNPSELRKAAHRARDLLDTDGPEPTEHQAYARESLTLTTADNGVKFRGYLANDNAELLRTLIHTGARPHRTIDGELDPRPRDKRQADALTAALTTAAAATDAGITLPAATAPTTTEANATTTEPTTARIPGFGAKANITVTIDFNDLKTATTDAIGTLVYGDGLSAATIRRLACDAKIIPLVLGSNSEPLDVGRAQRLVTAGMRRALNARDKGCVVCGAPPVQCDAHHLQSWIGGGITAIHNLALLCRRHHTDLHNGHWTITITNGVVHVTRPTWADPPPPARTKQAHQPQSPRRTSTPALSNQSTPARSLTTTPSNPSPTPPSARTTPPPAPSTTPADPTAPMHEPEPTTTAPQEPRPSTEPAPAPAPATASLTEPGVPVPPALVAAANALGSANRRTTTGAAILQRLLAAKGESTDPIEASSLRETATLAIWGEPATPPDRPVTTENKTSRTDPPLDAQDAQPSDPWSEPHNDQPSDRWSESPDDRPSDRWPELHDDPSSTQRHKSAAAPGPTP